MFNTYIPILISLLCLCFPCSTANASENNPPRWSWTHPPNDSRMPRSHQLHARWPCTLRRYHPRPSPLPHFTQRPGHYIHPHKNARRLPLRHMRDPCLSKIYRGNLGTTGEPLRVEGALELYFTIWPEVLRTAELIVGKCVRERGGTNGGYIRIRGSLGDDRGVVFYQCYRGGRKWLKRPGGWSRVGLMRRMRRGGL